MVVSETEVEEYSDNLYCFQCRAKMVELLPLKGYWCSCQVLATDAVTYAQVTSGWKPCLDCLDQEPRGCESCDYLGVILPLPKEGS